MSRCWTCRRRRLKCDGGVPHCQKCISNGEECLGYTKPLTWVEGVARRGPMKNRSFGEADKALVRSSSQPPRYGSPSPTLTEPLLQDLDDTSRFFIDYFSKGVCPVVVVQDHVGNRYRDILPLLKTSPVVASAITAVAACHYTHSLTNLPLAASRQRAAPLTDNAGLNLSRDALVERYLYSKSKCLTLLSASLNDQGQLHDESTFIAVVLLALLDLIESGSGSWIFHLEGAKKLLEAGIKNGQANLERGPGVLLHEIILFQAFGSSLTRPGVLTSVSDFHFTPVSLSPIACPVEIVRAVEEFASQRRLEATNVDVLRHTLETMRQLDTARWASLMVQDASAPSYKDLLRLGDIWKLSAEIYACRILRNMTGDMVLPPVEDLVNAYAFLDRKDDDLIKCLIWPTFIAGASSVDVATRGWALRTLDRIWAVAFVANVKNAAQVLKNLWEKQDQMTSQCIQEGTLESLDWDWVGELSQLEDSWLFV